MQRSECRQLGFSLIEIAIVLFLMALLASVAAVSARGMIGGATQQDLLAQIESLDAQARRQAQQTGQPVELVVDSDQGTITISAPDRYGDSMAIARYSLPAGYGFEQAWRWRRGQRDKQSLLNLQYDGMGITSTWGTTIAGPDTEEAITMLVLGETGQVLILEDDEQAQEILAQVHRRNPR